MAHDHVKMHASAFTAIYFATHGTPRQAGGYAAPAAALATRGYGAAAPIPRAAAVLAAMRGAA